MDHDPCCILNEDKIKQVVSADKSVKYVHIVNWHIDDFCKKGDNYVTCVTSVKGKCIINGKQEIFGYITKLNPQRRQSGFNNIVGKMFFKEGKFYTDILPEINFILQKSGQKVLAVPKCYLQIYKPRKEVLVFEDLRTLGFQMPDRKAELDIQHILLILKELARLHATSAAMNRSTELLKRFSFLENDCLQNISEDTKLFISFIAGQLEAAATYLMSNSMYSAVGRCLLTFKSGIAKHLANMLANNKTKFQVLCHGDPWKNNFLFRYDSNHAPVDVMMVDFQVCKVSSLATDLNYLICTCITRDNRNTQLLLQEYYKTFNYVLSVLGMEPLFSYKELEDEVRSKKLYGLLCALYIMPVLTLEEHDVPNFDELTEINANEFVDTQKHKTFQLLCNNEGFQKNFLLLIDDMTKDGVFG